jgi:electron transfer flavoprotein alpha subunit
MSAIYVWIETFKGQAIPTSWEALGAGRMVADGLNMPLVALVFGENAGTVAKEAGTYGANKVIVSEDSTLNGFRLEPYAALLTKVVQDNKPKAVLAIGTTRGRELLAASAADTDSGLLTEATSLELQGDGVLKIVRPVYAGKILSVAAGSPDSTQFVTLRARAFKANDPNAGTQAEIIAVSAALGEDAIATKVKGFEEEIGKVNLGDAAIIVSGGRGMANNPKEAPAGVPDATIWKAQEGFENTLKPLAEAPRAARRLTPDSSPTPIRSGRRGAPFPQICMSHVGFLARFSIRQGCAQAR